MKKSILFVFVAFVLLSNMACGMEQQDALPKDLQVDCFVYILSRLPDVTEEDVKSGRIFLRENFTELVEQAWNTFSIPKNSFTEILSKMLVKKASYAILSLHKSYPDERIMPFMKAIGEGAIIIGGARRSTTFLKLLFKITSTSIEKIENQIFNQAIERSLQDYFNNVETECIDMLKRFLNNNIHREKTNRYIADFEKELLEIDVLKSWCPEGWPKNAKEVIHTQKLAWVKELREAANLLKTPFPQELWKEVVAQRRLNIVVKTPYWSKQDQ